MASPINQQYSFSIRHADSIRYLQENTLQIAIAISTIAVVGSVLFLLSQQGIPLGPLNSSFLPGIGEDYAYLTLIAGISTLAVASVLTAALKRSYSNKQFTQKEVDTLKFFDGSTLGQYIHDNEILTKIEIGQYWPCHPPVQVGIPAVWAMVVKHLDGKVEIYAFKTPKACNTLCCKLEHMKSISYENGKEKFDNDDYFTSRYVQQFFDLNDASFHERLQAPIAPGQYRQLELQSRDQKHTAYVLKTENTEKPLFFKSFDLRKQYLKKHHARDTDENIDKIVQNLRQENPQLTVLSDFESWIEPIELNGKNCYLVIYNSKNPLVLNTLEELTELLHNDLHIRFVPASIESFIDSSVKVEPGEHYTTDEIQAFNGKLTLYWLATETSCYYFASARGRELYIKKYVEPSIALIPLFKTVLTQKNTCWPLKRTIEDGDGKTREVDILCYHDGSRIQMMYPKDMPASLKGLTNVKAEIEISGEYPPEFGKTLVSGKEKELEEAYDNSMLVTDEFSLSEYTETSGFAIPCFVAQIKKGHGEAVEYRYFVSEARAEHILKEEGLSDIEKRNLQLIKGMKQLSRCLLSKVGTWGLKTVYAVPYYPENMAVILKQNSSIEQDYIDLDAIPNSLGTADYYKNLVVYMNELEEFDETINQALNQLYSRMQKHYKSVLPNNRYVRVDNPGFIFLMWKDQYGTIAVKYFPIKKSEKALKILEKKGISLFEKKSYLETEPK